jgi:hypothetical protein
MSWLIAVFLRPFVALLLFLLAWWIARKIHWLIPPGKIRALLYSRLPVSLNRRRH